jgi:hypothetical protein
VGYQTGGAGSLALGNVLAGSIGNDTIISKSMTLPDYIITEGRADKITLAAGHTGADHVGFYAAAGNVNVGANGNIAATYAVGSVAGAISEGGAIELVNPGWWGIAAGGSSNQISTGAGTVFPTPGTGTSADQSTLIGFVPGSALTPQDILDFAVSAWGTGASGGLTVFGLTAENAAGTALVTASGGTTAVAAQVAPGSTIAGVANADLMVLSQGSFPDANALASVIGIGSDHTYDFGHSALTGWADFLIAYQGLDGNVHIADLNLLGNAGSTTTATDIAHVSDIVTLVGMNLSQLHAGNVHLV